MKNLKVPGRKKFIYLFCAISIYTAIKVDSTLLNALLVEGQSSKNILTDLFPRSITTLLFIVGIFLLIRYLPKAHVPLHDKIAGSLFAVIMLLGYCYQVAGSMSAIFSRKAALVISVCYLLGFYLIFTYSLFILQNCVKWCNTHNISFIDHISPRKLLYLSWAIIYMCWLPYIIIRYPAGVEYDAHHQIAQILGYSKITAHWPPASSAILGGVVLLGKMLFDSYDIGLFLLALFQAGVSAFVLAYTVSFMKKATVSSVWITISIVIYALVPIFPGYLTSIVKDSLFADMVVLFIVLLAEELFLSPKRNRILVISIVALLVCLLRNNGIYIIVFCAMTLLIYIFCTKRKNMFSLLFSFLVACLLYQGYGSILLPVLNIEKGSVKEALSIPFQQTARYFKEYPNEISEEEKIIVNSVLDADTIADIYNPLLSDPVKATYHGDQGALFSYFEVWLKQFVRHPMVYVDATLNNCYGFFFPDAIQRLPALSSGLYMGANSNTNLHFSEKEDWNYLKKGLSSYVSFWEKNPLTYPLCNFGVQICLTLYLIIRVVCYRQKKNLFLLLPSMVGILVCIASPTWWWNGFRYALPIVYANPVLIGSILFRGEENMEVTNYKQSKGF